MSRMGLVVAVITSLAAPISVAAQSRRLGYSTTSTAEIVPDGAGDELDPTAERAPGEEESAEEAQPTVRFAPGGGLRLQSADGDFGLRIGVRGQVQYALRGSDDGDPEHQMHLRRARLSLKGHFFGEHNRFGMQIALSPRDAGLRDSLAGDTPDHAPLLDYYLDFTHLRDLEVRVGHYKVPFNRTRMTSSANLSLVDRAAANGEFNLDRDIGVELRSSDLFGVDRLGYHAGVFMGRGRDGIGFGDFGMLYVARVEYAPLGTFDDLDEADFDRGGPRLSLGAAYAFQHDARRNRGTRGAAPADGGTTNVHNAVFDLSFKVAGLSVVGEVFFRDGTREPGDAVDELGVPVPVEDARTGWGTTGQVGYMFPFAPVELVARYSGVRRVGQRTSLEDLNELGGGVNWYVHEHALKLQADYFRVWDDDGRRDQLRVQLQGTL